MEMAFGSCAVSSQCSLLLLQRSSSRFGFGTYVPTLRAVCLQQSTSTFVDKTNRGRCFLPIRVVSSDSKASSVLTNTVDLATGGIDIPKPDIGGGGGGGNGFSGKGGGGGGGGDDGKGEGDGGSSEDSDGEKKMGLSMSQKLTLGYAALVGVGGLMGYLKSGSQKSLLAGGLSASVLYYVHTQLPSNPVFASSVGLGISAALMAVMGSRFMKSKKVFPAGVVSLVSLIMTGGYLHGILRSMH